MVQPLGQADQGQGLFRNHGVSGNLRDHRHILPGREAGDQVVELEDKSDMEPAVFRQLLLGGLGQIFAPI